MIIGRYSSLTFADDCYDMINRNNTWTHRSPSVIDLYWIRFHLAPYFSFDIKRTDKKENNQSIDRNNENISREREKQTHAYFNDQLRTFENSPLLHDL